MLKRAKESFWLLKGSVRHILLFELTYKLASTAVVYPLMILLINMVLKVTGIRYLTNGYIMNLLMNPVAIVFGAVCIIVFVLYCVYEMSFLTASIELKRQNRQASIIETGFTALVRMKSLLRWKYIPAAFFFFFTILTFNAVIIGNLIYSTSSTTFVKLYILNNSWEIQALLVLAFAMVYAIVIPGFYTMNIFFLENLTFTQAYKKSIQMFKKHKIATIWALIKYNLLILALIGLFYGLISVILIVGVKLLDMAYMGSVIYLSVLKYVRSATKLLLIYIAIPACYAMSSRRYYKYAQEDQIVYVAVPMRQKYLRINHVFYFSVLLISIILNLSYVALSFWENPFDKVAIFHETKITAHRGASSEAPENTLAAFQKAIDDMADYIELDVHLTKDNEVVVMHDANTYRITGVDAQIGDLTLAEIKQLDAGSYFSEEYAGETVPTLQEVLDLAKGKIKVNIEVKNDDNSEELARRVVDLIEQNNMDQDCVITSFSYSALQAAKQENSEIQVGYILSVAYGDFYNMDDIDFFSMNAAFLSKRMVDAIHNSGKQVYAWTVNNTTSIKNLTNKGVDNIITDEPVLARETVYSRNTSETLVNMIKYVFNQ